ncbi:hypothetical protein [Natronobacterium texcoconense]|uniref:Uncharacterized protein n=1 Tax=Natronobacterium texcoconense TaxID=1095778 RepID=A0A1H1EF57_NATTX|nr:hypothetical protein [Natronobacterium texcoconense]SDQ87461.1 hypothetical protein SAMN04489842_1564 [Natronobacterium texcoconense]
MKRALTLALVVAVVGGLTFMGLAGTAAAHDYDKNGVAEEQVAADVPQVQIGQAADASVNQAQDGNQVNLNNQEAGIEQSADANAGDGGEVVIEAPDDADENATDDNNTNTAGAAQAPVNPGPVFGDEVGDNVTIDAPVDTTITADGGDATVENVTQNADITQSAEQSNTATQNGEASAFNLIGS